MELEVVEERILGDSLIMLTLPGGELLHMVLCCEAQLGLSERPVRRTSWSHIVPEDWLPGLYKAMDQLRIQKKPCRVEVSGPVLGIEALHLHPLCDDEDNIIAIAWHGCFLYADNAAHREMFHRSAIAQWILDPRPVFYYLHNEGVSNETDLFEFLSAMPSRIGILRGLLTVIDVNQSAVKLYKVESIDRFKINVPARASDRAVLKAALAILSIADQPRRETYQTEMKFADEPSIDLWVSCEMPALSTLDNGMFISMLDITQLKQAEQESIEREQFLATILRTMPDILIIFDFKQRKPIFQNSDIATMLGYSEQDVQDTKGNIIDYITHPDDVRAGSFLREMYRCLEVGDVYENTLRLQHNNGGWHHFYFRSAALDRGSDGNVINAVVVARDITDVLKNRQILNEQQRRYRLLADNFSDVIIALDINFKINFVSPSAENLFGLTIDEFKKNPDFVYLLGVQGFVDRWQQALKQSLFQVDNVSSDFNDVVEVDVLAAHGTHVPVEIKVSVLRDEHRLLEGLLLVVRDVSDRRRNEIDRQLAVKVFENSTDAIYLTNMQGDISQVNNAFVHLTGYKAENVIGRKPSELGSGWHDIDFNKDILPKLGMYGSWSGELMSRRANGEAFLAWMTISQVKDARGRQTGMITSFRDITEARSKEEGIKKLAYYDALTDLPNRMLFGDRLYQAMQRANRNRHYVAVLFMDLDGFKGVNDDLGHAMGDRLLVEAGKRLKECIRSDDTVARMGGDEFTVILNALATKEMAETAAAQVARKIITKLNMPFLLDRHTACIGASIGIAFYPDDSHLQEDLIKLADTAMYHAKQAGKNNYQFFAEHMHQRADQLQQMEEELKKALEQHQLKLAYQPKLCTVDRTLIGFEILLRWQHPQQGLLLPGSFIRALDNMALSVQVGEWVVNQACKQLAAWQHDGNSTLTLSVNVFAHHYRDLHFVKTVADTIKRHGIRAENLTLEFSENVLMEDAGFAFGMLSNLKQLGVRIAIDDFGTGLMSLPAISRLPIDEVKIDRQFMLGIDEDNRQQQLVTALIGLAKNFGLSVVAEGIECESQLQALLRIDCHQVQGYLFYRPMFIEEVKRLISKEMA